MASDRCPNAAFEAAKPFQRSTKVPIPARVVPGHAMNDAPEHGKRSVKVMVPIVGNYEKGAGAGTTLRTRRCQAVAGFPLPGSTSCRLSAVAVVATPDDRAADPGRWPLTWRLSAGRAVIPFGPCLPTSAASPPSSLSPSRGLPLRARSMTGRPDGYVDRAGRLFGSPVATVMGNPIENVGTPICQPQDQASLRGGSRPIPQAPKRP